MRHGRAAKQRLWVGAIGHFCGCQRRLTKPDSNSNRDCHCYGHGHGYCNRNTYTNGNTYCNCNRNSDDHTRTDCKTCAIAEAASHSTCAEAIRRDFRAIS